jgi:predicted phage terminase large subunit-like protein
MKSLQLRSLASLQTCSFLPETHRQLFSLLGNSQPSQATEVGALLRTAFRTDLWLLLTLGLNRTDLAHPWLFERCQEVQNAPDGFLDLWPRGHYKSTLITFGKTIQDILASHGDDPLPQWANVGHEPTFVIFSHTRPIAKSFLRQIKVELQRNRLLHQLFPDILYESPEKQSPRWSEDAGLIVKRHSNPKEATLEAWGLVDGQPTAKHWNVMIYDDVVSREAVTSPEMIAKTTEGWELSLNLGDAEPRRRMIGTRWSFADSYRTVMERNAAIPRIHPGTHDGTLTGVPVFLTQKQWNDKVNDMGPYVAACQLLLNPVIDSKQRFLREWLSHQFDRSQGWQAMNRAMICDPASGKKSSDYTAIAVIGYGSDNNVYLLDMVRDRLTLQQRADEYLRLHRKWKIGWAGYEEYGLQADIEYLKERMDRETYHFEIEPLKGKLSKFDRVNRLIPIAAEGRFWMPESIMRTNCEGKLEDMVVNLVEQEFLAWPVPAYDDGIDAISRVFDLDMPWPLPVIKEHRDDRYSKPRKQGSWMSA